MVALIHNQMAVIGNAIIHRLFANQALQESHIQGAGQRFAASAQTADCLWRQIQK